MNPFNDRLDWALQGKYVEVATDEYLIRGWVEMVHHQRGSLVMHDCKRRVHPKYMEDEKESPASLVDEDDWQSVGAVFLRTVNTVTVVESEQGKDIEYISPEVTIPYDDHDLDFEPIDDHIRMAYRNGFTGGFPVVRKLPSDYENYDTNDRYQIINGHKRIKAAQLVGLRMHPMEVIRCTDEQAQELFEVAHRDQLRKQEKIDEVDEALHGSEEADGDAE